MLLTGSDAGEIHNCRGGRGNSDVYSSLWIRETEGRRREIGKRQGGKCMMIEMGKRLDEKEILDETERGKAVSAPAGARPQTPPSDYSMIQAPHRAGQNEAWVISVVVNPIRVRV